MIRNNFLVIFFSLSFSLRGQEMLTLSTAIETGLKNNYAVSIAGNESRIAANDVTYGNAGFLPVVTLNASGSLSSNDTKQKFTTGSEVDKAAARSHNISSGVALTWTLFDGMKMFITYERLGKLSRMGELSAKSQIENTVAQIITAYYDIVRQKQLLRLTDSSISMYDERIKIAEMRWKIGSSSKSELLQARVDRNAQLSSRLRMESALLSYKTSLNHLLARAAETEFDVTDSIAVAYAPSFDELRTSVMKQNPSLLFYETNVNVAGLMMKEIKSQWLPRLSLNLNYNFSRTENQAGFILFNQNTGINSGFTASWLIFNGFNTSRQYKNARLSFLNSGLLYSDVKLQTETELIKSWQHFQRLMRILVLEEENIKLARESMEISMERFRLGSATSLELKEVQNSYEDALARLVQARYEAKLAETELMRLNGALVK